MSSLKNRGVILEKQVKHENISYPIPVISPKHVARNRSGYSSRVSVQRNYNKDSLLNRTGVIDERNVVTGMGKRSKRRRTRKQKSRRSRK